jgi:hypothetical protein
LIFRPFLHLSQIPIVVNMPDFDRFEPGIRNFFKFESGLQSIKYSFLWSSLTFLKVWPNFIAYLKVCLHKNLYKVHITDFLKHFFSSPHVYLFPRENPFFPCFKTSKHVFRSFSGSNTIFNDKNFRKTSENVFWNFLTRAKMDWGGENFSFLNRLNKP